MKSNINNVIRIGLLAMFLGISGASAQTIQGTATGSNSAIVTNGGALIKSNLSAAKTRPNVTVATFVESSVIHLVDNSQFSDNIPPEMLLLLPYSAVIKNRSNQPIIAYTICWTGIDHKGEAYTDFRTVFDNNSSDGLILPATDLLVSSLGSSSLFTKPATVYESNNFGAESERLGQYKTLTVSLEMVMLQDGTIFGNDRTGSATQIKAMLAAERDVLLSVTEPPSPNLEQLTKWSHQINAGATLDLRNNPYDTWYRFYQASAAKDLCTEASTRTPEMMVKNSIQKLRNKRYPALLFK